MSDELNTRLIQAATRRKGLTAARLAEAAGIPLQTAKQVLHSRQFNRPTCRRVEIALNQAVWTPPEDFAALNVAAAHFGRELVFEKRRQLIKLAATLGITLHKDTTRAVVMDALLSALRQQFPEKFARLRKKRRLSPSFADSAIAPESRARGRTARGAGKRDHGPRKQSRPAASAAAAF